MPYSPMHLAILKTTPFFQISLKSPWVSLQLALLTTKRVLAQCFIKVVENLAGVILHRGYSQQNQSAWRSQAMCL